MHHRGRPAPGRPPILAALLATLLVVVGSGTVLAETSDQPPPTPPKPRIQRPGDVAGYRLPFESGMDIRVASSWNDPYSHFGRAKYAYDFAVPMYTPVLASASGVVSFVRSGQRGCGNKKKFKNRANYVTIDHPDGSSTLYGHLSSITVRVGEVVEVGELIAFSGKTGFTNCQPHLHFERGLQGHFRGLNQSIPIYFEEFPEARLFEGQIVHTAPACAAPVEAKAGGASAAAPSRASKPPLGKLCATYRGVETDSPILFQRLEDGIDYDWSERGPGGYWLDRADQPFAASWTGEFKIEEPGVYALDVRASDKVRVRIDGVTLVDAWTELVRPGDVSVSWRATTGKHTIEVEHLNRTGGGSLHVSWAPELLDGAWKRWSKAKPEA